MHCDCNSFRVNVKTFYYARTPVTWHFRLHNFYAAGDPYLIGTRVTHFPKHYDYQPKLPHYLTTAIQQTSPSANFGYGIIFKALCTMII